MKKKDDGKTLKEPREAYAARQNDALASTKIPGEKMIDRLKYPRQGRYTISDVMQLPDGTDVDLIDGVIYDRGGVTLAHQKIEGYLTLWLKLFHHPRRNVI